MSLQWPQGAWNVNTDAGNALSEASQKAAPAAGFSHYITNLVIANGSTGARTYLIRDGSATLMSIPMAASTLANIDLSRVPLKVGSAKALTITAAGTSTGGWIFIGGFTGRG